MQSLARYFNEIPPGPEEGGPANIPPPRTDGLNRGKEEVDQLRTHHWVDRWLWLPESIWSMISRRDRPVDYADDVDADHGGEKMGTGFRIGFGSSEIFPEYLPDKKGGRGYSSFGMIYEPGDDPRYLVPLGMSRRNVSGLDVVYLSAVCHTGTVRDLKRLRRSRDGFQECQLTSLTSAHGGHF